jgi:hypothetical protein
VLTINVGEINPDHLSLCPTIEGIGIIAKKCRATNKSARDSWVKPLF